MARLVALVGLVAEGHRAQADLRHDEAGAAQAALLHAPSVCTTAVIKSQRSGRAKARPKPIARPGGLRYKRLAMSDRPFEDHDTGVVTESEKKLKPPPMYKVLLHNDDYTTMEFVVQVLQSVFHKSHADATQIMLHVHRNGIGVAGVYTVRGRRDQGGGRRGAGAPARVPAQVHDGRGVRTGGPHDDDQSRARSHAGPGAARGGAPPARVPDPRARAVRAAARQRRVGGRAPLRRQRRPAQARGRPVPRGADGAACPSRRSAEPQQTLGFRRVLQRAALHVQSAGKDQIGGRDVLVSMFRETDSHAVYLLEQQGITRLDVVSYISHGVSKIGDDEDSGGDVGEDDEDGAGEEREPGAQAARELRGQSEPARRRGRHRPADRPRGRGRAHHPRALPAAQEQPALRRRRRASARPRSPRGWR